MFDYHSILLLISSLTIYKRPPTNEPELLMDPDEEYFEEEISEDEEPSDETQKKGYRDPTYAHNGTSQRQNFIQLI